MKSLEESDIIVTIRKELKRNADEATRQSGKRFFKEKVKLHGVKTAAVSAIAKKTFRTVRNGGKEAVLRICEGLWESGFMEESFIACHWSYELRDQYLPGDFAVFERWVSTHVRNWASCDTLCNHSIGTFIEMYPEYAAGLLQWTGSDNRWVRRASAVSLIIPARKGLFMREIFEIAERLLRDEDDLVQKGYGWLLKAASAAHEEEVYRFVLDRRDAMPRTALRYAIEKMPAHMKKEAMRR
jgi:3-methyladenine DNA glycosylase AlkD